MKSPSFPFAKNRAYATLTGTVIRVVPDRGYAFIRVDGLPFDYFANITDFLDRSAFSEGAMVSFEPGPMRQKPPARRIRPFHENEVSDEA